MVCGTSPSIIILDVGNRRNLSLRLSYWAEQNVWTHYEAEIRICVGEKKLKT